MMMKTMLVATSLRPEDSRYSRFVKLINRSSKKQFEIYPGLWVIQTSAERPNLVSRRLDALLDSDDNTPREETRSAAPIGERLFVCTILNDNDHSNGWVSRDFWDWMASIR